MGQIASLTLADGTMPTPVNRTFAAISGQMGDNISSVWAERTADRFNLFKKLNQIVRRSKGSTPGNVVKTTLLIPEASALDATQVAVTGRASIEFFVPDSMSAQGRKDMLAFMANYLDNQVAKDAIEGLPAH